MTHVGCTTLMMPLNTTTPTPSKSCRCAGSLKMTATSASWPLSSELGLSGAQNAQVAARKELSHTGADSPFIPMS